MSAKELLPFLKTSQPYHNSGTETANNKFLCIKRKNFFIQILAVASCFATGPMSLCQHNEESFWYIFRKIKYY